MFSKEQILEASPAGAKRMVRQNLLDSNEWLVRGLLCLFERQTEDEKRDEATRHLNRRGFNSADSEKLTSMAKQWLRKSWLSEYQMGFIRRRLLKYAGQLSRVARGEDRVVVATPVEGSRFHQLSAVRVADTKALCS